MGKTFDKFLLLIWKNFLLQWRRPIQTAIEILTPLILALVLVGLRGRRLPIENAALLYSPYLNTFPTYINSPSTSYILYSPKNPILEKIVTDTMRSMQMSTNITGLKNKRELEWYLMNVVDSNTDVFELFVAGIQFDDDLSKVKQLPEHINVTLRFRGDIQGNARSNWRTDVLYEQFPIAGPRYSWSNDGAYPYYSYYGFLTLQQELSYTIIKHLSNQTGGSFTRDSVPIYMQRFPYPKWLDDDLLEKLQYILGLVFVISYFCTCISTVNSITLEKEKKLKEMMKIMGLPNWLHWTAWFIKTFVFIFITIIIVVMLFTIKWYPNTAIVTNSNPLIILVLLVLYICASITFCFLLSVFFSRANLAAVIAGVAWIVTFIPYGLVVGLSDNVNLSSILAYSIFSNSAIAFAFQAILQYEGTHEGAQWHNIWKPVTSDENLVLGHVMIMLVVDTVLYLLLTIYVEAIFPGDYGVPEKWYFPFSPAYWCGKKQIVDGTDVQLIENEYSERDATQLQVGIQIKHLEKRFSKKNVAVKDLTLNIHKDQITVLLGHDGAGKTTTISMLTGTCLPTSGTAVVQGYDIRTQMPKIRENLGLCPQHNILFDDMTVREHFYFYSVLKGLDKEQTETETEKFVKLLEFTEKVDLKSATLSTDTKRKLSVAIALCGGSSIVMLDEPSLGMDALAKRSLWNLLQSQKKGRTIFLTTNFMDEADALGDQIAVMSNGELQCYSSSYFLKEKYGTGYHLIMDKSPSCDVNQVTRLLQKYIPNIQIDSDIGSELSYILNEDDSGVFQKMLGDLETQSTALGILSYGISRKNVDEILMKVHDEGKNAKDHLSNVSQNDVNPNDNTNLINDIKLNIRSNALTDSALWFNQIFAMFMKRCLSITRSWFLLLMQILVPVLTLTFIILISRGLIVRYNLPGIKIGLDVYNQSKTVLVRNQDNEYGKSYEDLLKTENTEIIDWGNESMTEKMLVETREKLNDVRLRYLVGATFSKNNSVTAWFNNYPLHTPPLALNLIMNAILQKEVSSKYYMDLYHHPLPFSEPSRVKDFKLVSMQLQIAIFLGFAMSFVSALYLLFYIRESVSNAKHLQFLYGVKIMIFWGSAFVCDLLTFLLTSLFIIATFAALQEEAFSSEEDLARIFSIFFHFGISVLPFVYLVSFTMRISVLRYIKMVIVFVTVIIGVVLFMKFSLDADDLKNGGLYFIHYFLLFIPQYSFCWSITDVADNYFIHKGCDSKIRQCMEFEPSRDCQSYVCEQYKKCCDTPGYYSFQQPGIGTNVLYAYLSSIGYFLIILAIEYGLFERTKHACYTNNTPVETMVEISQTDSEVEKEKDVIKNVPTAELKKFDVAMRSVTKRYGKFVAVNDLCLKANRYECFGLLGINGAGKTTTIKMMTGEIKLSSGDAWVGGLNVKTDIKEIHKFIGYCPQFDALLDNLTCRETILIFGLLRGLTLSQSKATVEKLSRDFDFCPHLDKKVKQLNGGDKRKLSIAISLIGDPLVLYFDEPTRGMDSITKRHIWRTLCKVRDSGKCIILTSRSIEECEALCTRIAIMVNGDFKCLGSAQHLKNKFSEGFTLIIRLRKTNGGYDLQSIENYVKQNFNSAVITENHLDLVTFYIPDRTKPWSEMFGIMEDAKQSLNIESYSLGQSSSEQVFSSFTEYQNIKASLLHQLNWTSLQQQLNWASIRHQLNWANLQNQLSWTRK